MSAVRQPLLGGGPLVDVLPPVAAWRISHAFFFLLAFYTIGSLGFLAVDIQEFITLLAESAALSLVGLNICLSAIGSALYTAGSVGFFPSISASAPLLGPYGFLLGSAFIGCSQFWKTHRIGGYSDDGAVKPFSLVSSEEVLTSAGVELSAGIGAWLFFASALPSAFGLSVSAPLILATYLVASVFFLVGGLFLSYRHFWMRI